MSTGQDNEKPAPRDIPNTKEIVMFFHCAGCMPDKPSNVTPAEWAQIEVGWTSFGIQVWCRRCDANMIHIDFDHHQHRANLARSK